MAESKHSPGNRGHYTVYSPEQKAEIARYAAEHGNLKAVCEKFSEEFGIEVKESTARQFKKAYFVQLNAGKDPDQITSLRGKKRGRPSKVGLYQQSAPSPSPSLGPTSFAFGVTPSPASVVVAEINGVAGEYDQMVGEMAISTYITVSLYVDFVAMSRLQGGVTTWSSSQKVGDSSPFQVPFKRFKGQVWQDRGVSAVLYPERMERDGEKGGGEGEREE